MIFNLSSPDDLLRALDYITSLEIEGQTIEIKGSKKQRTLPQNASLHLWCRWIAHDLAAAGFDFREVVSLPITPTEALVKDNIFKVIMKAMFPECVSTSDLTTVEMQSVYETTNNAVGVKFGVSRPWPSLENQSRDQQ